jgi:hypothetical protein
MVFNKPLSNDERLIIRLFRATSHCSLLRPGLHERTKRVRCNERHDIAVETERNSKIKTRHDVHQEGRMPIDFFLFLQQCHDARYNGPILCSRVAQALRPMVSHR